MIKFFRCNINDTDIESIKEMLEGDGSSEKDITSTLKVIKEKEKKDCINTRNSFLKGTLEFILGLSMLIIAYQSYSIQNNLGNITSKIEVQNLELNKTLTKNNKIEIDILQQQLYILKSQVSFSTIKELDNDIYDSKYSYIKNYLKTGIEIKDNGIIYSYLNNFENIYMSCHRGLIAKTDIKRNYQHLLGNICNNNHLEKYTKSGYGGLKKLCKLFYPNALISKMANGGNNCK